MAKRSFQPDFGDRAKALGTVIMLWREIEHAMDGFIERLSGDGMAQMHLVLGTINLREKTQILKVFAFYCLIGSDKEVFEELKTILNEIDNEMRVIRNRLIHDHLVGDDDGAVLTNRIPKFKREKATGKLTLDVGSHTPMSANILWDLAQRIYDLRGKLMLAEHKVNEAIKLTGRKPFENIFRSPRS